jgi:hypothetical protein
VFLPIESHAPDPNLGGSITDFGGSNYDIHLVGGDCVGAAVRQAKERSCREAAIKDPGANPIALSI